MFTLLLISAIGIFILSSAYFFRKISRLKSENLRLTNKMAEIEKKFEASIEQIVSNSENRFLETNDVLKNERERIAHELHDDIVQRLVSVRLRLEQLLYFALRSEVEDEINALRTEIGDALRDLRYVIEDLVQPEIENQDLNQLIDGIVSKTQLITRIKCELSFKGIDQAFRVPVEIKKEICLLVNEAIQNALKHSAGNLISVFVSWIPDLTIEISGDGVGFLKSRGANVGLNSMRQRCSKIGASFQAFNKMGRFHAVVIFNLPRPVQTSPLR